MPTEEVKGMMDIIAKLNEAEATPSSVARDKETQASINKLAGVSKDAEGMLSILQKLDEATTQVTKEIVKVRHVHHFVDIYASNKYTTQYRSHIHFLFNA